jgi:hypothetical protein
MAILNDFWQKYFAGKLTNPCSFLSKLRQQRAQDTAIPGTADRFINGAPPDELRFTAPERLRVGPAFMTSDRYLRYHNRADWQQTDPRIQLFAARLIETFRKRQIPLYVHAAFRTKEVQQEKFKQGHSKVQWPRASHCQGKSVDIVHAGYHWDMSKDEWALIGKVGKELAHRLGLEVTWGGDWSFYDPAHWELSDWREDIRPLRDQGKVERTPRAILLALRHSQGAVS